MNQDNELISETVQEVMGRTPSWIERSGNILILLTLLLLLSISAVIPYPVVVPFQFEVINTSKSIDFSTSNEEKILKSIVSENKTSFKKGDTILITENIDSLKYNYYLAPVDGSFNRLHQLNNGQIIGEASVFGTMVMDKPRKLQIEGQVNSQFYDFIFPEQSCILRFANGDIDQLKGFILSKDQISPEAYFRITVEIDEKDLPNIHIGKGNGKIIIAEKSLLETILTFINL